MAGVLPKAKLYIFLSLICLLINMCVFITVLIENDSQDFGSFTGSENYDLSPERSDNATVGDFAVLSGSSFIPFYNIVAFSNYIENIPIEVTLITVIIQTIISAVQVFLLSIIVLNLVPNFLGSGFDV